MLRAVQVEVDDDNSDQKIVWVRFVGDGDSDERSFWVGDDPLVLLERVANLCLATRLDQVMNDLVISTVKKAA